MLEHAGFQGDGEECVGRGVGRLFDNVGRTMTPEVRSFYSFFTYM